MKKILSYYHLCKEELFKVIFPTKEQIRNAYISVLVVVTVVALFLSLLDLIFSGVVSSIVG